MSGAAFVRVEDMSGMLSLMAAAEAEFQLATPEIDLASARLASELKHTSQRLVGLLPAGGADVFSVASALALALGTVTETMVVVVLPERAPPAMVEGDAPFAAWLGPSVAALAPARVADVGRKDQGIAALLDLQSTPADSNGHVRVDLTACERPGALLGTLSLLDGILIVGSAGRVSEPALARATELVPQHLRLGVLLHD